MKKFLTMVVDFQGYMILFLVWLISTLIFRAIICKTRSPKSKLPPSPLSLPIIGHLHLLRPIPQQALHKLSQRYGPLIHLSFGSVPCIVVSSPEMAKEFLKTHELSFCNRPSTVAVRCLTYGGDSDFSFAPYGPYWKFMKQITMTQLLGRKTVDRFADMREEEIRVFMKLMLEKSVEGKEVNLGEEVMNVANNVISRMTMGKRCSETDDEAGEVRKMIREVGAVTGEFNLQDYIWFCRNIDLQGIGKRVKKVQVKLDEMMEKIIKEHEEASKEEMEEWDMVDILLDIMQDDTSLIRLSRETVKAFILEMFTTGTATSGGVIQWAMAQLINNKTIFNKARDEIDSIVGTNRLIQESDIPKLPYLQAIVKETLRLHPSGPLFTRESTQDCIIGGYTIPAKTRLLVNVWSIGRDPKFWENPIEFKPERFMEESQIIDVRGQCYHFLPFGSGRRSCPGVSLALQVIQTMLGSMIQCFDWKVKNNHVDLSEAAGITLLMANPLICVPVGRLHFDKIIC